MPHLGFSILVDLTNCGVHVDGGKVGVSTDIRSGGGGAKDVKGVTFRLFTSTSALIVVGRIVSFLGLWRCVRYGYGGVVLSSVGIPG